jgi:hypothetical protein
MVDISPTSFAPQQPLTAPSAEELRQRAQDQETARATEQTRNADSEPGPPAREDRIEIQQQAVEEDERREDTERNEDGLGRQVDVRV